MRELTLREAAHYLGVTPHWVQRLLEQEILCSLCLDELEVYMEKAPLMLDSDFTRLAELTFLHGYNAVNMVYCSWV